MNERAQDRRVKFFRVIGNIEIYCLLKVGHPLNSNHITLVLTRDFCSTNLFYLFIYSWFLFLFFCLFKILLHSKFIKYHIHDALKFLIEIYLFF